MVPKLRRLAIVATAMAALAALVAAPPASATSRQASTALTGGATLWANNWIETFADSGGCGDFATSAVISGGSAPRSGRDWVKNTTRFDPWGIAPSVSAFGTSGDPVTGTWTNNNGSRGAYLSGTLCTSFWTLGVRATETASAFYFGVTRVASAAI